MWSTRSMSVLIVPPGFAYARRSARLDSQPEKLLPRGVVLVPLAVVPNLPAAIVTAVENLAELDVAELSHGEERGCLHLDSKATFSTPARDLGLGFAIECVGRPGLAEDVRAAVAVQNPLNHLESGCGWSYFAARGKIVIGHSLVADSRRRQHHVPARDLTIQHARASASNELSTAVRYQLLQKRPGSRSADTGVHYGQSAIIERKLIDRMEAHFAPKIVHRSQLALVHKALQYVTEEAQDCPIRQFVRRVPVTARLDYRIARRVELKYGPPYVHRIAPYQPDVPLIPLLRRYRSTTAATWQPSAATHGLCVSVASLQTVPFRRWRIAPRRWLRLSASRRCCPARREQTA